MPAEAQQHTPGTATADPSLLTHGEENLSPLAQLRRIQRVLYKRTQADDIEDKVLPAFACAWERLEERKRVLTMTPAPKPVEVKQKRTSSQDGPISPDLPARKPKAAKKSADDVAFGASDAARTANP